jgi:hypothetical protein
MGSGGFRHAAGANAGRADTHLFARTVDDRSNSAEIGIPAAPRNVVRVADRVAITRLFAADFTCKCHGSIAPDRGVIGKTPKTDAIKEFEEREAIWLQGVHAEPGF